MSEEEKRELKDFIINIRDYLNYLIENRQYLLPHRPDLHSLLEEAWKEIYPLFEKLTEKINEISEEELSKVGLTGVQLKLKLQQLNWRKTKVEEAKKEKDPRKIRDALSKLFNFIEGILDSLKKLIPGFEIIDEFKHTVADALSD